MSIEIKNLSNVNNFSANLADLTYNGVEFFDTIYMQQLISIASEKLFIGDLGQECYLGYDPEHDLFISGWDTWEDDSYNEDDNLYDSIRQDKTPDGCIAIIKMIDSKFVVIDTLGYGGEKFYKYKYQEMKEKYPTLIDIRLD